MIIRSVNAQVEDPKKGMTLSELEDFVNEASQAEIPGDTPVQILTGWNSQIKRIETR